MDFLLSGYAWKLSSSGTLSLSSTLGLNSLWRKRFWVVEQRFLKNAAPEVFFCYYQSEQKTANVKDAGDAVLISDILSVSLLSPQRLALVGSHKDLKQELTLHRELIFEVATPGRVYFLRCEDRIELQRLAAGLQRLAGLQAEILWPQGIGPEPSPLACVVQSRRAAGTLHPSVAARAASAMPTSNHMFGGDTRSMSISRAGVGGGGDGGGTQLPVLPTTLKASSASHLSITVGVSPRSSLTSAQSGVPELSLTSGSNQSGADRFSGTPSAAPSPARARDHPPGPPSLASTGACCSRLDTSVQSTASSRLVQAATFVTGAGVASSALAQRKEIVLDAAEEERLFDAQTGESARAPAPPRPSSNASSRKNLLSLLPQLEMPIASSNRSSFTSASGRQHSGPRSLNGSYTSVVSIASAANTSTSTVQAVQDDGAAVQDFLEATLARAAATKAFVAEEALSDDATRAEFRDLNSGIAAARQRRPGMAMPGMTRGAFGPGMTQSSHIYEGAEIEGKVDDKRPIAAPPPKRDVLDDSDDDEGDYGEDFAALAAKRRQAHAAARDADAKRMDRERQTYCGKEDTELVLEPPRSSLTATASSASKDQFLAPSINPAALALNSPGGSVRSAPSSWMMGGAMPGDLGGNGFSVPRAVAGSDVYTNGRGGSHGQAVGHGGLTWDDWDEHAVEDAELAKAGHSQVISNRQLSSPSQHSNTGKVAARAPVLVGGAVVQADADFATADWDDE